jgi:hypothetical protein
MLKGKGEDYSTRVRINGYKIGREIVRSFHCTFPYKGWQNTVSTHLVFGIKSAGSMRQHFQAEAQK